MIGLTFLSFILKQNIAIKVTKMNSIETTKKLIVNFWSTKFWTDMKSLQSLHPVLTGLSLIWMHSLRVSLRLILFSTIASLQAVIKAKNCRFAESQAVRKSREVKPWLTTSFSVRLRELVRELVWYSSGFRFEIQ